MLPQDRVRAPAPGSVSAAGIHRVTPTEPRGRKMVGAKGAIEVDPQHSEMTRDQIEWNARLERERKAKEER